jgi:hypothetical protein
MAEDNTLRRGFQNLGYTEEADAYADEGATDVWILGPKANAAMKGEEPGEPTDQPAPSEKEQTAS